MSTSPSRWSDSKNDRRIAFALGRAQMRKRNARRETLGHRGQIVFRAHAERAGAEADAVGLRRHGVEQRLIVFRRGGDARQAEQRPRRVVRMQRQRHAERFGDRRHAREKFAEVLSQHLGIDAAILLQAVAELRDRQRIGGGARQRAGDVGDEDVDIGLRHRLNRPPWRDGARLREYSAGASGRSRICRSNAANRSWSKRIALAPFGSSHSRSVRHQSTTGMKL